MITKNKTYTFEEIKKAFDKAKVETLDENIKKLDEGLNDPMVKIIQGMLATSVLCSLEQKLFVEGDE